MMLLLLTSDHTWKSRGGACRQVVPLHLHTGYSAAPVLCQPLSRWPHLLGPLAQWDIRRSLPTDRHPSSRRTSWHEPVASRRSNANLPSSCCSRAACPAWKEQALDGMSCEEAPETRPTLIKIWRQSLSVVANINRQGQVSLSTLLYVTVLQETVIYYEITIITIKKKVKFALCVSLNSLKDLTLVQVIFLPLDLMWFCFSI